MQRSKSGSGMRFAAQRVNSPLRPRGFRSDDHGRWQSRHRRDRKWPASIHRHDNLGRHAASWFAGASEPDDARGPRISFSIPCTARSPCPIRRPGTHFTRIGQAQSPKQTRPIPVRSSTSLEPDGGPLRDRSLLASRHPAVDYTGSPCLVSGKRPERTRTCCYQASRFLLRVWRLG